MFFKRKPYLFKVLENSSKKTLYSFSKLYSEFGVSSFLINFPQIKILRSGGIFFASMEEISISVRDKQSSFFKCSNNSSKDFDKTILAPPRLSSTSLVSWHKCWTQPSVNNSFEERSKYLICFKHPISESRRLI